MSATLERCGRSLFSTAVLLCVPGWVNAQAPAANAQPDSPNVIVTVNPLGFLQFGPTVELEQLASSQVGLTVGLRIPTAGLLAHLIDPNLGLAWLGIGELRFHSDSRRPLGWWWGPRGEVGKANSGGSTYTVKGAGLEVGHNRRLKSGRLLAAGAIAGAFKSESGLQGKFIMGVLSIGILR